MNGYINQSDNGPIIIRMGSSYSEKIRIDASGNVLVGTTSAYGTTGTTINQAGLVYSSADGDRAGQFDRTTSDGEIVRFSKAGTTVGSIGVQSTDQLYIATPDGSGVGLIFDGDNRKIDPTDGAGSNLDNAVDLGTGAYRFKDLYLSGGVVFDAVSGNATSNTLDDYEEGAWTPSMSGMGAATFSQQFGRYTKIGDLVHVTGKIEWTGANGTAQVNITGLPFTATNASDAQLRNSAWPQGDYRNINTLIQRNGHFRVDGVTLFGVVDNTNGYTAGMNCTTHVSSFGEFNFYLVYKST